MFTKCVPHATRGTPLPRHVPGDGEGPVHCQAARASEGDHSSAQVVEDVHIYISNIYIYIYIYIYMSMSHLIGVLKYERGGRGEHVRRYE